MRGRLHAQRRPRRGQHRLDRKIHHRRGVQGRLEAGHVARAPDRQARRDRRRGSRRARLRRRAGAPRRQGRWCSTATRASAAC